MLEQDNRAGWLIKFSATVVGIALAAYVWRCSNRRLGNSQEVDDAKDSELTCFCGLPAKLRISRTSKNVYRLFYNCPKNEYFHQCAFFRWSDEISTNSERHVVEKNLLRDECIHLQQKVDLSIFERQQERNDWDREEEEIRLRLSIVQSELDDINKRMQEINKSEEMPPVDDSYRVDDEHDDLFFNGGAVKPFVTVTMSWFWMKSLGVCWNTSLCNSFRNKSIAINEPKRCLQLMIPTTKMTSMMVQ